jgi:hypothetical protein
MNFSVSPTTFTAVDDLRPHRDPGISTQALRTHSISWQSVASREVRDIRPVRDAREAAQRFEALLFAMALRPLAQGMGFFGEIVADEVALAVVRSRRTAFGTEIERVLTHVPR